MPNIAEQIVEPVERLPGEAAREVLDFAQFLLLREAGREDRDLISAQYGSLDDWDNAEDDVWNDAPVVRHHFVALPIYGPISVQAPSGVGLEGRQCTG